MEGSSHIVYIPVDAGRLPIPGGQADLFGQTGQFPDEFQLLFAFQQGQVGILTALHPFLLQVPQDALDPSVGILDIIHRVFVVLPHGQAQIKLQVGVSGPGIKEVTGGIAGDLIQQVGQGDGLTGTLAHTHHFAIPHQPHQLHQHDLQPVRAIQAQDIQSSLQTGHMAMVIGLRTSGDKRTSESS